MQEEEVEHLPQNTGIIRHRGKIVHIVTPAPRLRWSKQNGESFADFVWSSADTSRRSNNNSCGQLPISIPTSTPASDALAKALKNAVSSLSVRLSATLWRRRGLVNDFIPAVFAIRRKHDSQIPE